MLLQIMLLKGVLEDNGIDPEVVLSSAGAALSEEASTEYDDDGDEEDDEEEEEGEEGVAAAASTAEAEAQSPGKAQDELSPCTSRLLDLSFTTNLHAPKVFWTFWGIFWGTLKHHLPGSDAMHTRSNTG